MPEQAPFPNRLSPEATALLHRWLNLHRILWLLTLACFFVAWNRGLALLYGLFALSLALLLISHAAPRLQLRSIRVERLLAGDLTAGREGTLIYQLSAPGRRYHLELNDDLPFATQNQSLFFSHWDGEKCQQPLSFLCEHRGRYFLDELNLSSAYPFGILTHSRLIQTTPLELLVLPRLFEFNRIPSPIMASASSEGDLSVAQQGGHDEFAAVREYVLGDSLRNIHWRASARRQQLVVKEYERSDQPVLLVALDCRADFNQGEGSRSTFEYAISIAASMIRFASRQGMQSILITETGQWHETLVPAYSSDLYDLYAFLAGLESTGQISSAELIEQAVSRFPQANLITGFRLHSDHRLPLLPPYLTHIDLELHEQSFLFPLSSQPHTGHHREGNRLIFPVETLSPIENLFQ